MMGLNGIKKWSIIRESKSIRDPSNTLYPLHVYRFKCNNKGGDILKKDKEELNREALKLARKITYAGGGNIRFACSTKPNKSTK